MRVLVTGATGYIGGRLVPRLVQQGRTVRCVVRDPSRLAGRGWDTVEIIEGDLSDPAVLPRVLEGVDVAYYLIHSMATGDTFGELDRMMATHFGMAAAVAGLKRIIYLGGLGDPATVSSKHLVSRHEVGRALAVGGVPVLEFRAAVIIGSGSASFEIIRHLTERLPLMITPDWVNTRCQPIGVRDVLDYLLQALDHPTAAGVFEIGGPDVLTYREMMLRYGRARGLRRWIITMPVPHPTLSARFVDLLTPVPYRIAKPLIESLQTETVVRDDSARRHFTVEPATYDLAVSRALERMATDDVQTTWASSLASFGDQLVASRQLAVHEGMLLDRSRCTVRAPATVVFEVICSLGGNAGWPSGNWLWQLRGVMDRMAGGVGMRRGRRHPRELHLGEPLDFWRVEALEPPHLLRLRAEMQLPGNAWLQFEVLDDTVGSRVEQTAFYDPRGFLGYLYWWAVHPFHRFIFPGMIRAIGRRSEERHRAAVTARSAPERHLELLG
jgi:uncharacterized protein YbjT (DUF2867 family)